MSWHLIGRLIALVLLTIALRPSATVASPDGDWTLVQSWSDVQSSLTTPPFEVTSPQWRVLIESQPANPGPGANPSIEVTIYRLNGTDRTRVGTIQADPSSRTEQMESGAGRYLLFIDAQSTQWTVSVEELQ
jgi:hypothetical protein